MASPAARKRNRIARRRTNQRDQNRKASKNALTRAIEREKNIPSIRLPLIAHAESIQIGSRRGWRVGGYEIYFGPPKQ